VRAWRLSHDRGARKVPDHEAGVATWLVNGPFHPLWSWWGVSVVSLRDMPGVRPPLRFYEGAEYEFVIVSLDPDQEVDIEAWEEGRGGFRWLTPLDAQVQFHGTTDEQAAEVAELAVEAILDGHASPDQDWRSWWEVAIPNTVEHVTRGMHAPEGEA
jgi:hypothetical protein